MDSSALMKLVWREDHSDALTSWVKSDPPDIVISELVVAECMRTARRLSPQVVHDTRTLLRTFRLRTMSEDIWTWACEINPLSLRTLSFGALLDSVVTYDKRLTDACTAYGVRVIAPA
jgi:predicted nucleic acid-binding protein